MPCVLTSFKMAVRPTRQLTTARAEGGNIPPRRRGRSWGRGHRRSQAPSPARPEAPKRADPTQAFRQHLYDASARAAGPAAPSHTDALASLFPDSAAPAFAATPSTPLHLQRQYVAALDTLALFCPASVSTVDLGGNDWQAPAAPGAVTAASLADLVEAARLSDATPEPGTVTHHDASLVRKLGLGSCNLPARLPHFVTTNPTPNAPSAAPRRRLPPTPAQRSSPQHPPAPAPRPRPSPAARLRCGSAAAPTPTSPATAPATHSPLPTPAPHHPTAAPLRFSGAAPATHSAPRLRTLAHAAPHPGLGARRPQSPARPPICPTAAPTAAACGPRRRVISEALSSSMRGFLGTPPTAYDDTSLPPTPPLSLSADPTPASDPQAPAAAGPRHHHATRPQGRAAQLVAEHLGLGGQALCAGDEARLGMVLESFGALAGAGFVPQHVGQLQYSSWLVRRSGADASGMWHAAVRCALAPLAQ